MCDYIPSGVHFSRDTVNLDNKSPQNSPTTLLQESIDNFESESLSDDCEEIEGGVYSNTLDILNDRGELCHVNGFSLQLPLSNMGVSFLTLIPYSLSSKITATYAAGEVGIKSDADLFITHYIQNYISKTQISRGDTFEEFLLDDNLDILNEVEEENNLALPDDKLDHIPLRLQKLMQEYQSHSNFIHPPNEIDEIEDIGRSFDDIESF